MKYNKQGRLKVQYRKISRLNDMKLGRNEMETIERYEEI